MDVAAVVLKRLRFFPLPVKDSSSDLQYGALFHVCARTLKKNRVKNWRKYVVRFRAACWHSAQRKNGTNVPRWSKGGVTKEQEAIRKKVSNLPFQTFILVFAVCTFDMKPKRRKQCLEKFCKELYRAVECGEWY